MAYYEDFIQELDNDVAAEYIVNHWSDCFDCEDFTVDSYNLSVGNEDRDSDLIVPILDALGLDVRDGNVTHVETTHHRADFLAYHLQSLVNYMHEHSIDSETLRPHLLQSLKITVQEIGPRFTF